MRRKKNIRGSLVVVLVVGMALLLLLIPPLTQWLRKDAKDAVRYQHVLQSSNLAAAGLEKVEWRISGDASLSAALVSGTAPPGYSGDVEYSDIEGGVYKVDVALSTGAHSTGYTLTVRAKENRTNLVKAVKATYVKPEFNVAAPVSYVSASGVYADIHWSPIVGSNISAGAVLPDFPRLLSGSYITNIDTNPAAPNSGVGWVSYDSNLANNQAPSVDFGYYKGKAVASRVPVATAGGAIQLFPTRSDNVMFIPNGAPPVSNPPGSAYFPGSDNVLAKGVIGNDQVNLGFMNNGGGGYVFQNSTSVIFVAGREINAETFVFMDTGTFLDVEALVVTGMNYAAFVYAAGAGGGVVVSSIPEGAPLEYASAAGLAVWNAGGASSMATAYAQPNHCCYTINNVNVHGLIVTEDLLPNTHAGVFVGGVVSDGAGSHMGDVFGVSGRTYRDSIYYEPAVMANLRTTNTPVRKSWEEVSASW